MFVDLGMSRNRLANIRRNVLIPIVFTAMSNKHNALLFDFSNQIAALHTTSRVEWRRAGTGIFPDESSL